MSGKTKTIEINPSLFTVNGFTKKNKTKKNTITSAPLISPNILKNKLLKRIKDHKNKETENLENNKKNLSSTIPKIDNTLNEKKTVNDINKYTDEFNDSIEYLQTLSKQNKINSSINNKKEAIQRKTIKNHNSMPEPFVNLELPEELQETFINTNNEIISTSNIILPNYKLDSVPYGILKGGSKPTYRQWNQTHKNYQSNNLEVVNSNNQISEREQRLNLLKQKLKQQSTIVTQPTQIPTQVHTQVHTQIPTQVHTQIPTQIVTQPIQTQQNLEEILLTKNLIQKPKQEFIINPQIETPIINNLSHNNETIVGGGPEKIKTTKKLLKKTIHKKYTLGKSNIKRTVAVLLKDNNTRKNIINAQKVLKNKPVNDIKTYLRHHNLIKIGSNAPNDVIRKIYESAMLAGEITNNNKDIMLHNFIKEDN